MRDTSYYRSKEYKLITHTHTHTNKRAQTSCKLNNLQQLTCIETTFNMFEICQAVHKLKFSIDHCI